MGKRVYIVILSDVDTETMEELLKQLRAVEAGPTPGGRYEDPEEPNHN